MGFTNREIKYFEKKGFQHRQQILFTYCKTWLTTYKESSDTFNIFWSEPERKNVTICFANHATHHRCILPGIRPT